MIQLRPAKRVTLSVGESVRIVRNVQQLSQNHLARLSGIPQGTISSRRSVWRGQVLRIRIMGSDDGADSSSPRCLGAGRTDVGEGRSPNVHASTSRRERPRMNNPRRFSPREAPGIVAV